MYTCMCGCSEQMGDYRSLSRQKRDLEAQIKAAATTLSRSVSE